MNSKSIAFDTKVFHDGMTIDEYQDLVSQLAADGKTSGPNQSEAMIHYTQMNARRMNRWNKTMNISEDYRSAIMSQNSPVNILVITEAWCGDAAHNIPFISSLEKLNPNFKIQLILRDEHEEVIDAYLTKGGRSIPKVVAFNETGEELFTWGPRPIPAQQLYDEGKAAGKPYQELSESLQVWYNKDKGSTLMGELTPLLKRIQEKSPIN